MAKQQRLTLHRARVNKGGSAFSVRHNDRDFNIERDSHIDPYRQKKNVYYTYNNATTFEQSEKDFYKSFEPHLQKQNEKYKNRGQYKRMKTADDYRRNPKTCPEESLFYIGEKDNEIPPELFEKVLQDFIEWHEKEFPTIKILNYAIHRDEQGAQHGHIRQVYTSKDDNGDLIVSQTKCLEELGFENHKQRYDNAKILYTKACRSKVLEIAKQYGIDINTTPNRRQGMDLDVFKEVKGRLDVVESYLTERGLMEDFLRYNAEHSKKYHKQAHDDLDRNFDNNEPEIDRE